MSQEITTDSCPVSKLVRALELENDKLRGDVKLYRGELVKLVQSTDKLIEENES